MLILQAEAFFHSQVSRHSYFSISATLENCCCFAVRFTAGCSDARHASQEHGLPRDLASSCPFAPPPRLETLDHSHQQHSLSPASILRAGQLTGGERSKSRGSWLERGCEEALCVFLQQLGRGCSAAVGEALCRGAPGLSGMDGELRQAGPQSRRALRQRGGGRGGHVSPPRSAPSP